MVWAVVAGLFVVAAGVVILPLWRHTERPLPVGVDGDLEEDIQDGLDEKKRLLSNLRQLRLDYAEGKVTEQDFRAMEEEYEGQLAALLEQVQQARVRQRAEVPSRRDLHRLGSAVLVMFLGGVSFLLFNAYWQPVAPEAPSPHGGSEAMGAPDIGAMVSRLEQRLEANPNDLKGQIMLARSYASLGRNEDAIKVWEKALELEPGNKEAMGGLVLSLLQGGTEAGAKAALKHLEVLMKSDPDEPGWLWYQGMAFNLLGRQDEARAVLKKLLGRLPPESEDAAMVRDALGQLDQQKLDRLN